MQSPANPSLMKIPIIRGKIQVNLPTPLTIQAITLAISLAFQNFLLHGRNSKQGANREGAGRETGIEERRSHDNWRFLILLLVDVLGSAYAHFSNSVQY